MTKQEKFKRTKKGLVSTIYTHQVDHSKRRGHNLPTYTRQELYEWVINNGCFNELYYNWVDSGYVKLLLPSVDRIKDDLGYSFNNIQLTTWEENHIKGYSDKRKPIIAMNKTTLEEIEFSSIMDASRSLNMTHKSISAVVNKRLKSSNNYTFKFR